jgi:Flp pilus assembly protein TadB
VEDPLVNALEEIAPKLTAELERVMAALRAGEPVEDAWETMLQEILDEA